MLWKKYTDGISWKNKSFETKKPYTQMFPVEHMSNTMAANLKILMCISQTQHKIQWDPYTKPSSEHRNFESIKV